MGWLTVPNGGGSETGVLILPAVGYQYWSAHRSLRVIAEQLAAGGHLALRLDYDGTGDSGSEQTEPERVSAWRASVKAGAAQLRALGCERLVIVGVRLGATLALLDGAELGAAAIVAWAPVLSGRRYAREIRMLSTPVPDEQISGQSSGAVAVAGTYFSAETLAELGELDPMKLEAAPAQRVLLVDGADQSKLGERLRGLGSEVEQLTIAGGETALEAPTEEATVPEGIVRAIEQWVGPASPASGGTRPLPSIDSGTRLGWHGNELQEEVVRLGANQLVAITTEAVSCDAVNTDAVAGAAARAPSAEAMPVKVTSSGVTAVFLNTGSEAHVGPGRAWVEYARELARLGHRAVRVDFRGWGESPDDGHAPGRPYDAHCEQDTVAIVRALRERGHERIVLVGLCASAWVALRTILHESVTGVIALNPQLYWQPGDPVEATMAETRLRRTAEREREERGGRNGLWTALDLVGSRPWAGRWLDELCDSGVPVKMVYAAGDDGLEYLHNRLRRRFAHAQSAGAVSVVEIAEIDHSMHRLWLRERVVEVLHRELLVLAS
jgi:dienelactone hydrolase